MFRTFISKALAAAGIAVVASAIGFAILSTTSGSADAAGPQPTPTATPTTAPTGDTPLDPSATGVTNFENWPLWIQGRPHGLDAGDTNGWYFWHDDSGLHLRTTTPSDKDHPFEAVLTTTGGTFFDISKVRLEGADDIKLTDGGHRLVVKFHTYAGIDGVDFRTTGDHLRLNLQEFGHQVPVSHIFAGHFDLHPNSNPFGVNR